MSTLRERFDASQCKGGCHPTGCMCSVVEDALAEIERLRALVTRAASMLDDSQSPYIPVCEETDEWNRQRDLLVAELRASEQTENGESNG